MKAIVLVSGGMDSATLLYHYVSLYGPENVKALAFNYGQRHRTELKASWWLCQHVNVEHELVSIEGVRHFLGSALTSPQIEVPEGHYEEESMRATVVPMRNAIFLTVAVGHAWTIGAKVVGTAIHAGDHAIYPDCRPEFLSAFNVMVEKAAEGFTVPQVEAPFVHMSKMDIARMGQDLGVPWERTWSCYKGGYIHCGKCGTCVERREALAPFGDPTRYA